MLGAGMGCGTDTASHDKLRNGGSTGYYDDYDEPDQPEGSTSSGECVGSECQEGGEESSGSTGGEECLVEDDVECCIELCAQAPAGIPPGGSFDCPVEQMPYNCGCAGTDLFDCDDYAYACENWAAAQGIVACSYGFYFELPDGTTGGHAINIYEEDYPGPNAKYCFYEPQPGGGTITCWIQEEGDPDPPDWAQDIVCAQWGGECTGSPTISCDGDHLPGSGEACFTTNAQVCDRFQAETGICPETWEPDYDCTFTHPDGDVVHWSCDDDETCGTMPNECVPVEPPEEPDYDYESCASINGNNESCYWECYDGESCGEACYSCN